MPVAPSFQDLLTIGQAEAQVRRPDLAFFDGDVTVAQLHGSAAMADRVVQYAAEAYRATFIDGATGDELTQLVDDHCGIQRKGATAAQVTLTLTRTSGGAAGTIPAGTRVATDFDPGGNQVIFSLDGAVTIGAGSNGPFSASATAVDAGTSGNVAAGSVTKVLDPLFDASFAVTNAGAAGGGNQEESDPELRARARLFFVTLHRGTLASLEFGALEVPSVRIAHAVEDPGTLAVTVLVSDQDGSSSLQMRSDVTAELENWRCAGVLVSVLGGQTALVDLDIFLASVRVGFDVQAARQAIIDIVTSRIARLKTGETLYLDSITAAIIAVAPDDIFDVTYEAITIAGTPVPFFGDVIAPPVASYTFRAGTIEVSG